MDSGWRDLSPEVEAFSILANETRLRILAATWSLWLWRGDVVPYTDLMEAVDIDDSGQFNYHMEQLRGRFVQEEHGGYAPTAQAARALGSLGSRRYHDVENDRQDVEGRCPVCGGGFEVGYHWNFYLGCTGCWEPHVYRRRVSPTALESRDWRDLMVEYNRVLRHKLAGNLAGTCIECGSETGFRFFRLGTYYGRNRLRDLHVVSHCHSCSYAWRGTVGLLLLAHPTVREYADDHGIDLDAKPFWHHEWTLTDLTTTVRDADPTAAKDGEALADCRVEKVATVDGCRLAVVFADDGSVETVTHVDMRRDGRDAPEHQGQRECDRPSGKRAGLASDGGPGNDGGSGTEGGR